MAAARYGLEKQGNAVSDPLDEMGGKNVLYRALDNKALARQFKVDLMAVGERNAAVDKRLRAARRTRPAVPVDDKVVAVWNGYMMTTLALAGRLLDEPRYIKAAEATANFVLGNLYEAGQGVLYRDWREGKRGVAAFSEDYAGVAEGLLAIYKVTGNKRWLNSAVALVATLLATFRDTDNGGFFSTAADTELWLREKQASDGATLSANGIAIHVLQQLGELTGNPEYNRFAWETAAWAGAQLNGAAAAMPYTLIVWEDVSTATLDRKQ
jgi:uncharacterized protein YyaL (SSP411 family)